MLTVLLALSVAAAPEVALLSSRGDVGELRFQRLDEATSSEPVVRFTHGEGSPVLGTLLPGTRVVVASAAMQSRGDLSFASVLLRLEAGQPARVLADGLAYGSRPLVSAEGRVFISRGVAGAEPADARGALRVDGLSVEEIDRKTGRARVVYATRGYFTFLAGAAGRELIIYESAPAGARLISVQVDTLAVRVLLPSLAPLAHDFVVDAPRGRVLFTEGTPGADDWFVQEVQLKTGASRILARGPEVTMLPTVLEDSRVLVSRGAGQGLSALDGEQVLAPRGPGFERVQLQRGGLILGLHEVPSDFPVPFVWQRGAPGLLAAPPESRLDLAGVTP